MKGITVGFIGAGMMAEALIGGALKMELLPAGKIVASDVNPARRSHLAQKYGVRVTGNNRDVVAWADLVVLAVKPQHASGVLAEIGPALAPEKTVLSIMAGVSTAAIESYLSPGVPVVRAMPNTPCLVGAGVSAVARGRWAGDEHAELAAALLKATGHVVRVDEGQMDAVTGLSGSGPAYVFTVIEALADGGVAEGLPRPVALELAAHTVLGAAKLLLESGDHPAVLRERVTSPAGTTAEGLLVLEDRGVRSVFARAVREAARRSKALGEGTA